MDRNVFSVIEFVLPLYVSPLYPSHPRTARSLWIHSFYDSIPYSDRDETFQYVNLSRTHPIRQPHEPPTAHNPVKNPGIIPHTFSTAHIPHLLLLAAISSETILIKIRTQFESTTFVVFFTDFFNHQHCNPPLFGGVAHVKHTQTHSSFCGSGSEALVTELISAVAAGGVSRQMRGAVSR